MYKEEVLFYYKNQPHQKVLDNSTHAGVSSNLSCGDELKIQLLVEDGIIKDVGYIHSGCIISGAIASMISEKLIGSKIDILKNLDRESWLDSLNIELTPARRKCALVVYSAFMDSVKQNGEDHKKK